MSMHLKIFFLFASITAAHAKTVQVKMHVMPSKYNQEALALDDESDEVSFLQAQVETVRRAQSDTIAADHEVVANEYNIADDLQCMGGAKASGESVAPSTAPMMAAVQISENDSKTGLDDPPGAGFLRSVLHFLIFLIVLDGVRRSLQLQKQKSSQPKGSVRHDILQPSQKDAAALESSWVDMVNAARTGDECNFSKALGPNSLLKCVDAWGCTALHFAAVGGSVAIARGILEQGAEIDALDAGDETPLHFAAREGHASMCEFLLAAGASIDAVSKDSLTPLAVAGLANQEETCRALTRCGAGVAGMSDAELPILIVSQLVKQMFVA